MIKIILKPSSMDNLKQSLLNSDCFILGIKDFSINMNFYITLDELKEIIPIIKSNNKEILISLNKIMHNKDLIELENILIELNKLDIDGILYSDIAIINIYKRLKMDKQLISNQYHQVTNYHTCNFWYSKGIKKAIVSGEITLDSIIEMKKNTSMKLIVPVFGFLIMFITKRKLVSNYFNHINQNKEKNIYYLYEKAQNNTYPIIEDDNGTSILSNNILNGIEEMPILFANNIDYILIDGTNFDDDTLNYILEIYYDVRKTIVSNSINELELHELYAKINKRLSFPTYKGFYYKETIYKVRNNE